MPYRTERINFAEQRFIRRDRRMAPHAAVAQSHNRHARRERHAATKRRRHPRFRAIRNPDARRDRLQRVDRFVQPVVEHEIPNAFSTAALVEAAFVRSQSMDARGYPDEPDALLLASASNDAAITDDRTLVHPP